MFREHIALEIQGLAGTPVTYGKTRSASDGAGVYYVMYSYAEERVGLLAARMALRLINSLLPAELEGIQGLELLTPDGDGGELEAGIPFNFRAELDELIRLAQRLALGPTTQSLVDEARRRDIPAIRLDDHSLVQLGLGKYQKRVWATVTSRTGGHRRRHRRQQGADQPPAARGRHPRAARRARPHAPKRPWPRRSGWATRW